MLSGRIRAVSAAPGSEGSPPAAANTAAYNADALAGRFCARVDSARRISTSSASGTGASSVNGNGDKRASGSPASCQGN